MFLKNFKFGNKRVGKDSKIFFIAEIGINHNGDLDIAKKFFKYSEILKKFRSNSYN